MNRFLSLCMIVLLVSAGVWAKAKEKHDAQSLIARSDAAYYYPTVQGVTDMAVDLSVPSWADTELKDVKITYYYAGDNRQQFDITNLPAKMADKRAQLLEQLAPYTNFLVPTTAAKSFKGYKVKSEVVYRQFIDEPETMFYLLVGTTSDANAAVKELHVLLDKNGLMHQMESIPQKGVPVIMEVKNTRVGDKWQISQLITRMPSDIKDPLWQVINIEYGMVDGKYSLPSRVIGNQCDSVKNPVDADMVVLFQNYRINKGVADAFLPQVKTAPAPPVPAHAPVAPADNVPVAPADTKK